MNKKVGFILLLIFLAIFILVQLLSPSTDEEINTWIEEPDEYALISFLFGSSDVDNITLARKKTIIDSAYSKNFETLIYSIENYHLFKEGKFIDKELAELVLNAMRSNNRKGKPELMNFLIEDYFKENDHFRMTIGNFLRQQDKQGILNQVISKKLTLVSKLYASQENDIYDEYSNLNYFQNTILGFNTSEEDSKLAQVLRDYISFLPQEINIILKKQDSLRQVLRDEGNTLSELFDEIDRTQNTLKETEDKRDKLPEVMWISGNITDEVSSLFPNVARREDCAGLYEIHSGSNISLVCMQEHIYNRTGYTRLLVKYEGKEIAVNQYSGHKIYLPFYVEVTEVENKYRNAVFNIIDKVERELRHLKNRPQYLEYKSRVNKLNKEIESLEHDKQSLITKYNNKLQAALDAMKESY